MHNKTPLPHSGKRRFTWRTVSVQLHAPSVGASMLAMTVRAMWGCQAVRVIVGDHRERARSYRQCRLAHGEYSAACAFCRREHARDDRESDAGCQAVRVIVGDHRERARSYRQCRWRTVSILLYAPSVGASMLAMTVRATWGVRQHALLLATIASALAPEGQCRQRPQKRRLPSAG